MGTAVLGLGLAVTTPAAAAPTAITVGIAGPGVYPGTVVVDKPLTLRGAQHGVDARAGRTDVARESVIDGGGLAGIQITGTTSGVTVDGFTIRNSGTETQVHDGIEAFSGGGGFSFVNNVVTRTTYGINMNSAGPAPSTVSRSRFDSNNNSGGQGGSGVFICCGPGNNLSITDNLFTGNNSAAVNTAGAANNLSTGLKIQHNQSINDATFAVVVNAKGAVVSDNVVTFTNKAAFAAGSAFYIGGGTNGVQVTGNSIIGGAATGIRVTNAFGVANIGLVVSGNHVVSRKNGMQLTAQTSGSIKSNDVAQSAAVGILLDSDNAGVTVTGNKVAASTTFDCQDSSTGNKTLGTANTWTGNVGLRSQPKALCGAR